MVAALLPSNQHMLVTGSQIWTNFWSEQFSSDLFFLLFSKLLQRHICTHLILYLCLFNLIVSTQSGFQPLHSTESLTIKMTDDWLEAMDQGLYTGAILLDLHKAFDVVNHDLLVAKLQMHGCFSSALLWLKSYVLVRPSTVCHTLQEPYLILKYWDLEFLRAQFWALPSSSYSSMTCP